MSKSIFTIGIDVGSSYIKTVLINYSDTIEITDKHIDKIRKRNPAIVAEESIDYLLSKNNLKFSDSNNSKASGPFNAYSMSYFLSVSKLANTCIFTGLSSTTRILYSLFSIR